MSLEISESLLQLRSLHTDLRDAFIKLLRHISCTLPTCCLWVPSRNSCCTIYFYIMMASTTKITPQINPCQSLTASPFNHSFFNQYWYAARYLNKKSDWEPPLTKVAAFDSSSKLSSSHARLLCRGSSDFCGYSSSSIQLRFNIMCHSTLDFPIIIFLTATMPGLIMVWSCCHVVDVFCRCLPLLSAKRQQPHWSLNWTTAAIHTYRSFGHQWCWM